MNGPVPLLHSAVGIMTPLLLAATGGLFTELAGTLNIALEGLLLIGAFAALIGAHGSGSLWIGLLAGLFSAMTLAAVQSFFILKLKANVFITGLAANLFASGFTIVLSYRLFATRGVLAFSGLEGLKTFGIPGFPKIPVIWDLFIGHTWYTYGAWLLLFLCWLVLYRTPFGFRLRGCEQRAEALASLGLKPDRYRFAAFLISGFTCGAGGSFLSLNLGVFVPNISSGKGWIALVIIFLGNRRPLGLLAGGLFFGLAEAFSNYAQGIFNVPADFILAVPYIFTLFVMIGVSLVKKE
jgi:simple sugar transport system permease protein